MSIQFPKRGGAKRAREETKTRTVAASAAPSPFNSMVGPSPTGRLQLPGQGRFVGPLLSEPGPSIPAIRMQLSSDPFPTVGTNNVANVEIAAPPKHMIVPRHAKPIDRVTAGECTFAYRRDGRRFRNIPAGAGTEYFGLAALNLKLSSKDGRQVFGKDAKPWKVFKFVGVATANPSGQLMHRGQCQLSTDVGGEAIQIPHVWMAHTSEVSDTVSLSTFNSRLFLVWKFVSPSPASYTSLRRDEQLILRPDISFWQVYPVILGPGESHEKGLKRGQIITVGRPTRCNAVDRSALSRICATARQAAGLDPFRSDPIRRSRIALAELPRLGILLLI